MDGDGTDHVHLSVAESSDSGATWSDIAGATATTYTPPAGSAGNQVHVIVTATNSGGMGQATSPASAVILANPPVNTVAPSISGTAKDGVAITAVKGTWTGVATITYTYQWQQSSRRRRHLEQHRRRNRNDLHATRRFRRQAGACRS